MQDRQDEADWYDIEADAMRAGRRTARAVARGPKLYVVSWYSPLRQRRTSFMRSIEADNATDAKRQARAMITNEKPANLIAREVSGLQMRKVNPKRQKIRGKASKLRRLSARQQALLSKKRLLDSFAPEYLDRLHALNAEIENIQQERDRLDPRAARTWERLWHPLEARRSKSNPAKTQDAISEKIARLVREGYPHKQAVAIAFSEKRAGKLNPSKAQSFNARRNPSKGSREIERLEEVWWKWHDADQSRWSVSVSEAEKRARAWALGLSNDGPDRAGKWKRTGKLPDRQNPTNPRNPACQNPAIYNPARTQKDAAHKHADRARQILRERDAIIASASRLSDVGFRKAMKRFQALGKEYERIDRKRSAALLYKYAGIKPNPWFEVHATPKIKRQEMSIRALTQDGTARKAKRRLGPYRKAFDVRVSRLNPKKQDRETNPSTHQMSERFLGNASGAMRELKASRRAPADLSRAGKLTFLKLAGRRAQLRIPGAIVAIDPRTERLWITGNRAPLLMPKAAPGTVRDYGEINTICYAVAKEHIGNGKRFEYTHDFGEGGGRKPHLQVDTDGMPLIVGGDYRIRAEGIVG